MDNPIERHHPGSELVAQQPTGQLPLNPSVPRALAGRLLWLPDRSRSMGTHIMAGRGSGKSRLMGRVFAWVDFIRGVPVVILDPTGSTIDNFLDKFLWLPREYQERLWPRVIYVDMSGRSDDHIIPMPLYYRLANENLYTVAQRYLEVIRRADPYLMTASIEGWNALARIGTYTGMALAALGYQITEAEDLLNRPEAYLPRIKAALKHHPDLEPALAFFTGEYVEWDERVRGRQTATFRNKLTMFVEPVMGALFGAATPGIDWQKVVDGGYAVLFDFRGDHDLERRRFKMLWAFLCCLEYIKHRGPGRHKPISLIIDEVTALTNFATMGQRALADELDELVNVIARQYSVWPTVAHQELWQVDEKLQKAFLSMGTQILGSTSDMEAALVLAQQFFRINPYKVKRYESVWMTPPSTRFVSGWPPVVIDERPVEFTIEEQHYQAAYRIKDQEAFHFLVRPAAGEGDIRGGFHAVTIRHFDEGRWVHEGLVAQVRSLLMQRRGLPVSEVLGEIGARRRAKPTSHLKADRPPSTMAPDEQRPVIVPADLPDDDEPVFGEKATTTQAATE